MTVHTDIRFEEPPPRTRRRRKPTKHQTVAAALRSRVGDWAHVGTYPTSGSGISMAYTIRKGKLAAYAPAGSFDATSRKVDGAYRVYVRYTGPVGESA